MVDSPKQNDKYKPPSDRTR